MQSLTLIIFTVSEKFATLKFRPHMDTQLARQPNTDNYIHFHAVKNKKNSAINMISFCSHFIFRQSLAGKSGCLEWICSEMTLCGVQDKI